MSDLNGVLILALLAAPLTLPHQMIAQSDPIQSQESSAERSLRGKHRIEIGIGFMTEMSASHEVSIGSVTARNEATGLGGTLAYTHWLSNAWAIGLSVGMIGADATTTVSGIGASVESATVIPVLAGVRFQPLGLTSGDMFRPYVSASVGPVFGSASNVQTGVIPSIAALSISAAETAASQSSYTETAFGSRVGVGADVLLGKRFTLGFGVGYCLVSDFNRRIGSETNYSGPDVALSVGVLLGGSRR